MREFVVVLLFCCQRIQRMYKMVINTDELNMYDFKNHENVI